MKASFSLQLQTHAPLSWEEIVLSMLGSAFCAAGTAAVLIPLFSHLRDMWALYGLFSGFLAAAFCLLSFLRPGRWLSVSVSITVLLIFAIWFKTFRNGMFVLANNLLEYLTGRTGRVYPHFEITGDKGFLLVVLLYLILISVISGVMISRRHLFYPVILLTAGAAAAVLRLPSSPYSLPILSLAVVLSLVVCRRRNASLHGKAAGFLAALLPAGISLASVAALFLFLAFLTGGDVFPTDAAADTIHGQLHRLSYEPDGTPGMPEGDLRRSKQPADPSAPMLELSMDHPEKLYLRGFTGDIYEDSVWQTPDSQTFLDNAALFAVLHENGFYGQNMIASAAKSTGSDAAVEAIQIQPLGACRKYRYLPYGLDDPALLDTRMIGDAGVYTDHTAGGKDEGYLVSYLPGGLPEWYEAELMLAKQADEAAVSDYLRLEQAYSDYVFSMDNRLSEEAAAVCADLFGTEAKTRRLADILALVRETLNTGFVYDESADMYADLTDSADASDVFTAFMQAGHGGSVHYATAAALMLRYLGIPSRYVEGYFLSEQEASSLSPDGTFLLTAEHAHAWAEFYLRGIGWIPFETTPGFVDNEELSRITTLTEDAQAASGGSPLYTQTAVIYTSGVHNALSPLERIKQLSFTWKPEYLWLMLLAALCFFLTALLIRLCISRSDYRKGMRKIRNAKERNAYDQVIALEFGYASMLIETAGLSAPDGLEQIRQLNEEARFSTHSFTIEQVRQAESFTESVLASCKKTWSLKERLYYRWICGII